MRIRPTHTFGVLGLVVGLAAIISGPPAQAASTCGCHARAHHHHIRAARWRHVAHSVGHTYARVDSEAWGHERRLSSENDWRESHGWREGDREAFWSERPWATDQFGFLTWPGKSHFVDGRPMRGPMPPPPPADMQDPPPSVDWQGPPPPGAEEGYRTYRF